MEEEVALVFGFVQTLARVAREVGDFGHRMSKGKPNLLISFM